MIPESKIRVTLSRVYEYKISEVRNFIIKENEYLKFLKKSTIEINDESIKESASSLALSDFSEEMVFFEESAEDFVSVKVEII